MSLEDRISSLKNKHQDLENAIEVETNRPNPDEIQLHTLKKEKLRIKDEIANLSHP